MDRLLAAANGKSASQGGMNLPEIKAYLAKEGVSITGSGGDLRTRLAGMLGGAEGSPPMPSQSYVPAPAPARARPKPGARKPSANLRADMLKNGRLSASAYYGEYGEESYGDICDIRDDGTYKCLVPRKGSVAYWTAPAKSGNVLKYCGSAPWEERCKV